jgi:ribonuclease HII
VVAFFDIFCLTGGFILLFLDYDEIWYDRGMKLIAGADEAGRGPLAGPVVAAAVILKKDTVFEGLNDSKKLTAKKRDALYGEITGGCLCYAIECIDNNVIDEINILKASLLAMENAVNALKIKPEIVLVDGNYALSMLSEPVVKGDAKSMSIAAASVLAKVYRDRIMQNYDAVYPGYGFAKHKGYPTKQHYEAIEKYGVTSIHRQSFRLKNYG